MKASSHWIDTADNLLASLGSLWKNSACAVLELVSRRLKLCATHVAGSIRFLTWCPPLDPTSFFRKTQTQEREHSWGLLRLRQLLGSQATLLSRLKGFVVDMSPSGWCR